MRDVWSLTQKGKDTQLGAETTSALFRDVQRQFAVAPLRRTMNCRKGLNQQKRRTIVRPSSPWLGRFSPLASFQSSLQLLLELVGRIANINALAVPPSVAPVPATLPPGLGRRPPQEPTAQRFMEHHGELAPRH